MSVSSATILPIHVAEYGVSGAGFRITVQPAASAGVIFERLSMNGKFHGVIAPTTPIGSRTTSRFEFMPKNSWLPSSVLPLVAVDHVDVPLHVVDAGVLLDRERETDRRADLGDDLRAQLFLVLVERFLQLLQARLAERAIGRPAGLVERPPGGGDGALHVGRRPRRRPGR